MKYKKSGDGVLTIGDDVLVFDIETDGLDTETANMKWFGGFSFRDNAYYFFTGEHTEDIQKLIDDHKVVVGYNSRDFDIPICENNGLSFEYKIRIDLMRVLFLPETRRSVREAIIKVKGKILKNVLKNHKLSTVAETLDLSVMKGDIDYRIFQKDEWTKDETQEILKYLYADVKITKELFEYLYKEFLPFKQYMSPEDQRKYNWYRTSPASMVYKIVCHAAGLEEEYGERPKTRKNFEGGLVLTPKREETKGNIIAFDFASLYPNIMIQCALFSDNCDCCTEDEKWTGDGFFPVQGKYCSKKQSKIEQFVKDLFIKRMKWKAEGNTSMVYTAKIILNSLYGASSSPLFKSIHTEFIGSDTTAIARQCLRTAVETFERNGYEVIYGDTDSCYVKIPDGKTKEDGQKIADEVVSILQSHMPFAH
jgi:DNA polymerase elongation subunit (family B)